MSKPSCFKSNAKDADAAAVVLVVVVSFALEVLVLVVFIVSQRDRGGEEIEATRTAIVTRDRCGLRVLVCFVFLSV